MKKNVYVVHCIDTEGPLNEKLDATFERIYEHTGVKLEVSTKNLELVQSGLIDLKGKEAFAQKAFSKQLLDYMNNWDKLDEMLNTVQSNSFRNKFKDSVGRGWIYNWFCLDNVDWLENPRERTIGHHAIYDRYHERLKLAENHKDSIQFHFHPRNFNNHAHLVGTHWLNNGNHIYQILSRKIIDRMWFPSVNRPGFHVTRSDSNWFLEQFIPFDYANQALNEADQKKQTLLDYRFGDWRSAPYSSTPYHPSHDDYKKEGDCRRWVARCMNIGTRHSLLSEDDVLMAFETANKGLPSILAFTNHDFRDMEPDILSVQRMLKKVSDLYPEVSFIYSNASNAFREALDLKIEKPCSLDIQFKSINNVPYIEVEADIKTFGPQHYLALKTKDGNYYHDNFLIEENHRKWIYFFDEHTLELKDIESIGIATNNKCGFTSVVKVDPHTRKILVKEYV